MRVEQRAHTREIGRDLERLGLECALALARRREGLDPVIENIGGCQSRVQLGRARTILRPYLVDRSGNQATQISTCLLGLYAVVSQDAIEQRDVGGELRDLASLGVVGVLC